MPVFGISSSRSAVWARMSESICSFNFLRVVQYEAVEDEGVFIPLMEAYDCSLRITCHTGTIGIQYLAEESPESVFLGKLNCFKNVYNFIQINKYS
jgi:hypothetical protein